MTNRFVICFFIFNLCLFGCLGGKSKKTAEQNVTRAETNTPPTIAELHLSLAKPAYGKAEAIPVEMTIQIGKFDLLIPFVTVEEKGAFTKLIVKDSTGKVVKPKYPITMVSQTKTLIRKDKEVRCIQGIDLKAETERKAVLDDLQRYYKLGPGDYTLQVLVDMEVYRESLPDRSPQILELEQSIATIQRDPNLPADSKTQAINSLREDIEYFLSTQEEKSDRIYLPVDSLRGSAELESNAIMLKIE